MAGLVAPFSPEQRADGLHGRRVRVCTAHVVLVGRSGRSFRMGRHIRRSESVCFCAVVPVWCCLHPFETRNVRAQFTLVYDRRVQIKEALKSKIFISKSPRCKSLKPGDRMLRENLRNVPLLYSASHFCVQPTGRWCGRFVVYRLADRMNSARTYAVVFSGFYTR